jgi:hypothetical protein
VLNRNLELGDSPSLTDIMKAVERSNDRPRLIKNSHTAITALINHTSSEVYESLSHDEVSYRSWMESLKDIKHHCDKSLDFMHKKLREQSEDLDD